MGNTSVKVKAFGLLQADLPGGRPRPETDLVLFKPSPDRDISEVYEALAIVRVLEPGSMQINSKFCAIIY